MKDAKNGQWYTKFKKMCKYDQHKSESITVQEIEHLSNEEQAEAIADSFSAISHRYQPIDRSQITVPPFSPKSIPQFTLAQVRKCLSKIKTNKSTAPGDIPPKIIKQFSMYLGTPLADIINSSLSAGHWPTLYKKETINPFPKQFPPLNRELLRPISIFFHLQDNGRISFRHVY